MDRRAKVDAGSGKTLPARIDVAAAIGDGQEEARHRRSDRQYGGSGRSHPRAHRMREARDCLVLARGASGCIRFC